MAKKLHLVHVKSNVLDKAPSASTINYGEIAVNYNADSPALYIRDDDDNIVKFISEPYFLKIVGTGVTENDSETITPISEIIQQDEETVAAALNDLNSRKADKDYVDEAVSGITIDIDNSLDSASTNPVENQAVTNALFDVEETVAASLNDLNNRKADISYVDEAVSSITIDIDSELDSASTNPVENQAVTNALLDVEETVAAALNDLNDRKADKDYVDEAVSSVTIDVDSELDSASTNPVENRVITQVILDNEETVAAALNDLNDRKSDKEYVDEAVSSITIDVDSELDSASTNPVENQAITNALFDVEETVAAALNDLNDRKADKDYVDEAVSSITIDIDSELDSASTNPVENQAITNALLDVEETVAAALNDLNDRKADISYVDEAVSSITIDVDSELDSASTNPVENRAIYAILEEDEQAIAASLNDLNDRKADKDYVDAAVSAVTIDVDDEINSGSSNPVENRVIYQALWENEIVVAGALNDLNNKIAITGVTETGSGNAVTGITVDRKVLTVAKGNISGGGVGSVGTLNTTATSAQATSASESFENNITLHKISKTGNYNDLLNKPTVITGITINSAAKTVTNGVVDLGTVVTAQTSVSTGTSGNGNVLTNITLGGTNNHTLTLVKGMTIPTWATSSTKPSYTASEVGAMASNATLDNVPDGTTRKLSNYLSGATMNGSAKSVTNGVVDLGTVVTAQTQLSTGATQGSGNVVTSLAVSDHQITLTKGITIPAWATASTKPSYTASEVGAVSSATFNTHTGTTMASRTSSQMHLPTVSVTDNGKILRVVNGAWALVDPATIYSGSGTPAQSLGNDGDIYLQTS